jgi:endoglucanase
MMKLGMLLLACFTYIASISQSDPRIPVVAISSSENTGQDYTSWLNDDVNDLVADVWGTNAKYIDVKLELQSTSLVSKLSFFDGAGSFASKPAYIYAVKGNERVYLGKFEGLAYNEFVHLTVNSPVLAEAIVVRKYGNNLPQKVLVYGQSFIAGMSAEPLTRLFYTSPIPAENTGQDYNQWLNDDVGSTIGWGNANSFKYIDVSLPLQQRSRIKKFSFWDTEGEFSSNPCYLYAAKGSQRTLLGTFTGPSYNTWIDLELPESILADSIIVHKYSRYIPQKINIYGQPLLNDPLDTIALPEGRIMFTDIQASINTGQSYNAWYTDNLDTLVPILNSTANQTYVDITLQLERKSKIGRLSLFADTTDFTNLPAYIYAKNDTAKKLLATFTGSDTKGYIEYYLPDSAIADAIIVRKYANHFPQKIKLFGSAYTPPVITDTIDTGIDTTVIVKIPINAARWYQLNNVTDAVDKMFDGITDANIYAGYGKILTNYDAYYPVRKDEHINLESIKFYDGEGSLGDYPLTLSVINDAGQKIPIATFNGNRYNQWVGPYPDRIGNDNNHFRLDSIIKNVRYIVLNCWYMYPNEIEFYGNYKAGAIIDTVVPTKPIRFKDVTGINAFEWDFESPYDPMKIDSISYAAIKTFSGVRHYMDWEKLESNEGSYTYSPVHSGGWNYDAIYERCKADGIEVLACLKTIPGWLQNTYPNSERDSENIPVPFGSNLSDPASYIKQAKLGFQYIARYGSNTAVNPSLLSVNSNPRWTHDDINVVKIGLGLIKYIECDNERDKWWKGRKAYQTAYEYAANLSAFYDGHMQTLGPGVGVKNADSTVKVVMAGLAAPDPSYVRGMIEWCRKNRGYKPDGSVNLCWDVINYHLYSNDAHSSQTGNSTRGIAPEKSEAAAVAREFKKLAHEEAHDMPVWITELGYDLHEGSPLKAIAIGNKSVMQTQADWNLRSALLYAREGIEKVFFYQLYDDNPTVPIQFGSMGFLNPDRSRKPSADYVRQANELIGNYTFIRTLNYDPLVDEYELFGKPAYVLTIPDEVGRTATYNLALPGIDSVKICTPTPGSDTMQIRYAETVNGALAVEVSETPVFVLPLNITHTSDETREDMLPPVDQQHLINLFPNPSTNSITVTFKNDTIYETHIRIVAASTGKIELTTKSGKGNNFVSKNISVSNLSTGLYIMEIQQGSLKKYRKFLKISN